MWLGHGLTIADGIVRLGRTPLTCDFQGKDKQRRRTCPFSLGHRLGFTFRGLHGVLEHGRILRDYLKSVTLSEACPLGAKGLATENMRFFAANDI